MERPMMVDRPFDLQHPDLDQAIISRRLLTRHRTEADGGVARLVGDGKPSIGA